MILSEIPQIFFDADYIPADLLFKNRAYPPVIKIKGRYWYLNVDSQYPYYEKYKDLT